jgi:hypothetical protein
MQTRPTFSSFPRFLLVSSITAQERAWRIRSALSWLVFS